jgi:hypothetical protein
MNKSINLSEIYEKFDFNDIEDVRIIIKAKGKHWGIVQKNDAKKEEAKTTRIAILTYLLK